MDIFTNPTMNWIAPLVLSGILLIAALIGFWSGWKTSLYFLVWNIFALIIAIAVYKTSFTEGIKHIPKEIKSGSGSSQSTINIQKILQDNKESVVSIWGVIFAITIIVISNVLAFLIYWIVWPLRKSLKRSLKVDKKKGYSNTGFRFIGSGISIVATMPLALFATSIATSVSSSNKFTEINSKLVKGISFAQFKDVNEQIDEFATIASVIADQKLTDIIKMIFADPKTSNPKPLTERESQNISTLINSQIFHNSLLELKNQLMGVKATVDFSTPPTAALVNAPFVESQDQEKLSNVIADKLGQDRKQVNVYLTKLLGW